MNTLEKNFSDLNSTREQNIPQINNQAAFISLKISHVFQSLKKIASLIWKITYLIYSRENPATSFFNWVVEVLRWQDWEQVNHLGIEML